ncbi:MAG: CoA transferase [Gammaproteobacteria bacterium]|nr:CoA transferase [Gammaproteobacteria bacterium]
MKTQADSVTNATPPLDGVKILDFSRIIAGPLATQQLADLGATIIKIENPATGDDVRGLDEDGQPARSPFFMGFNRNKKSVAIDLKNPTGQRMALDLARQCDVLVQNFRPGVMDRFGLDHERVMSICPKLIYVSISAYGEHGSMSDRPGYDPVLQAESGMMAMTGEPDGRPMRTALSLIDTLTAGHATSAVCAALIAREKTGRGDYLDLALMDTAIAALGNMAMAWLGMGVVPERVGNRHIYATPNGLFRTATDPIYMAIASNRLFTRFCENVIERPDLPRDERFAKPPDRLKNRELLWEILEGELMKQPAEHWIPRMRDLPAGQVRTVDKALASPEVAERGMVRTLEEADGNTISLLAPPFRYQNTPLAAPESPPYIGEHTDEVLREWLGIDEAKLKDLHERRVIR